MNLNVSKVAESDPQACPLSMRRALFLALAFIVPAYFGMLFGHDLWRPAETREAGIARVMIESGNWTATYLNGSLFLEKPPLYTWALAAAIKVFGYHDWAIRLPVFGFALGTLLLTFSLAGRRAGPVGALAAAIGLATMWLFLEVNHGAMIDNGLVFFMTLAMLAFERMSAGARRHTAWACLFYVALSLAFLTKGVIGVALVGIAVITFTVWTRPRPALQAWHPIAGLLIMTVLIGGWLLALWQRGGADYFEVFFIRHHLVRFLGLTPYHPDGYPSAPWYYYLSYLVTGPAPWTLLILPGIWLAFRQARQDPGDARRYWRLMACWVAGMFLLLSIARSKDNQYLLPAFPPLAIVIGTWVAYLNVGQLSAGRLPRWAMALTRLTVALLSSVAWLLPLIPAVIRHQPWAPVDWILSMALALLGGWTLVALVRGQFALVWLRLAALVLAAILVFAWCIKPLMNAAKSTKPFCETLCKIIAPGAVFYGYGLNENTIGALTFYGPRPARLVALRDTLDWGIAPDPVYLLMAPRDDSWALCDLVMRSGNWRIFYETRDGRRAFRLLGNRACKSIMPP